MKKLIVLLLCALLLTGCTGTKDAQEPSPTATVTAAAATRDPAEKTTGMNLFFDTVITVTFYGAQDGLMDDLWDVCRRYEQLLSRTVATSDVSRINSANGETVTVDAETWAILKCAREISEMTEGAFSVTIAPVSTLWDFTSEVKRKPTAEELSAALPLVDDGKLVLGENNTVTLPAGMMVDLGGIAKGYIADRIAEMARGRCTAMVLSLGGNVYCVGDKPDGSLNGVGIRDPWHRDPFTDMVGVVRMKNTSVVTSGTYERVFEMDGVRYHHILDPKTGMSSTSDLVSATFVMDSSMTADALATACIVWGSERSMAFVNQHGFDAVFIRDDGTILTSDGFTDRYKLDLYALANP